MTADEVMTIVSKLDLTDPQIAGFFELWKQDEDKNLNTLRNILAIQEGTLTFEGGNVCPTDGPTRPGS